MTILRGWSQPGRFKFKRLQHRPSPRRLPRGMLDIPIINMNVPMRDNTRVVAAVNVTVVMVMTGTITGTDIMGTIYQRRMLTKIICTPRMGAPQEQHRLWPPQP